MSIKKSYSGVPLLKGFRAVTRISVSVAAVCVMMSTTVVQAAAPADSVFAIVSGKDNYWKVGEVTEGTGGTTVTVNENQKNQKWLGLAGCFNEAGWDALQKLSAADRDKAIKLLFDKNDGIGFSYGRIPIGSSDYGLSRYTLNETKDDFSMTNFSIERDKKCLLLYIKAAQAVKPDLKFWASAWTPPPWMKTGAIDAAGYDGGAMKNQPQYLAANALYTSKFCETYKAEGVPISFVFPQNEPGYAQNYPSCGWGRTRSADGNSTTAGPEYLSTYVASYLKDTLAKRCPDTKIWYGCLSNDVTAPDYWNGMKAKANVKSFVMGGGFQWNCITFVKSAAADGYLTMCSEHQCGNYPWLSAKATSVENATRDNFLESMAPNNHAYGEESWDLAKKWIREGVNIYSAWNMVLDTKGLNLDQTRKWPQNALLAIDVTAKTLKVTPYYYVMRHIGQYVDTGAVFLGSTGGDALAFKNPNGSYVTVVFNSATSQTATTITVGGKSRKINVPARGWATLCTNWPKPVGVAVTAAGKAENSLKVIRKDNGYAVTLPSRGAGRVELLTVSGRVLESRVIPQGCSEITLSKQATPSGLLLVRVVNGSEIKTARLFNAQ